MGFLGDLQEERESLLKRLVVWLENFVKRRKFGKKKIKFQKLKFLALKAAELKFCKNSERTQTESFKIITLIRIQVKIL